LEVDLSQHGPGQRSHSVLRTGCLNSVNDATRAEGDVEWKHLDDSVYGGDFLNHQPPSNECASGGQNHRSARRQWRPVHRPWKDISTAGARRHALCTHSLRWRNDRSAASLCPHEQVRLWESEGEDQALRVLGIPRIDSGRVRVCRGCVGSICSRWRFRGSALIRACSETLWQRSDFGR